MAATGVAPCWEATWAAVIAPRIIFSVTPSLLKGVTKPNAVRSLALETNSRAVSVATAAYACAVGGEVGDSFIIASPNHPDKTGDVGVSLFDELLGWEVAEG